MSQSTSTPSRPATVEVLGIGVHALTFEAALDACVALASVPRPQHVVTVNPEFVMTARRDPAFRDALVNADLALADGVGMTLAARWVGTPLPERVPGADLVPALCVELGRRGIGVFLLGAAPGVARGAGERLSARGARVVGAFSGSPSDADFPELASRVRAASPGALFVAFGSPRQDLWIARHKAELGVPLMMGVGGTFDFLVGVQRRAPRWVGRLGLEWLWRLVLEPWRWRRQTALIAFAAAVLAAHPLGPLGSRR